MLKKSNFDYLNKLAKNNNREWFTDHKKLYEKNREEIIEFADELLEYLKEHDDIETISGKKSVYRIYRDVRFSKDKTPYKTHWSGYFGRATNLLRGGYYFHIEPGNCFLGGGFWGPSSSDLKLIRTNILDYGDELKEIINSSEFKKHFKVLKGDKLKSCPKGFDKNHKQIDLLRYKQYLVVKHFSDEEVLHKDFAKTINESFKAMRPFFNYMSEALTTDANGEPLY